MNRNDGKSCKRCKLLGLQNNYVCFFPDTLTSIKIPVSVTKSLFTQL